MEITNDLSLMIGGKAGAGIFASGIIFAKTCMRGGLNVFATNEYPSIIRGGHQWVLIRVSDKPIYSQIRRVDLLIALDKLTYEIHRDEVSDSGGIIVDSTLIIGEDDSRLYGIPISEILKKYEAKPVMANMVALGAAIGLLDYDIDVLKGVIRDHFKGREGLVELNIKLAEEGYEYSKKHHSGFVFRLKSLKEGSQKILVSGNDATAMGALAAGLTFYAAYPMTPATPILHFLSRIQKEYGLIVIQPENEIAAINMVIGAAYAGARAMTATSGGGFSLMVEALGQAAMTEVPIVVVVVQRPGPSTGMPTFTSQGDLRFVLHASQGEFPRIVVAPGDPLEAYMLTADAMNLAWKYQVPAIVLTDKYLAESLWSIDFFPGIEPIEENIIREKYSSSEPYARYKLTDSGISPLALPGTNGVIVRVNSSEHDEFGFGTIDPGKVVEMVNKRFRKLSMLSDEAERKGVKAYGNGNIVIVSWGSTKGPILEATKDFRDSIRFVQFLWLSPFPRKGASKALDGAEKILLVENNKTGLLGSLLNEYLHINPDLSLLKYDGRPFYPEEIRGWLKKCLGE